MEWLAWALLLGGGLHLANKHAQKQRVAWLSQFLMRYPIDRSLERLVRETMTGLNHTDEGKRLHHWQVAHSAADELVLNLQRAVGDMGNGFAPMARGCKLPIALPYAEQWWPNQAFDVRRVLQVHVEALARIQASAPPHDPGTDAKTQAFIRLAEVMLLQHTCHWYCRSQTIASARLLAQHHTRYEQVLQSVHPETLTAYRRALSQIA